VRRDARACQGRQGGRGGEARRQSQADKAEIEAVQQESRRRGERVCELRASRLRELRFSAIVALVIRRGGDIRPRPTVKRSNEESFPSAWRGQPVQGSDNDDNTLQVSWASKTSKFARRQSMEKGPGACRYRLSGFFCSRVPEQVLRLICSYVGDIQVCPTQIEGWTPIVCAFKGLELNTRLNWHEAAQALAKVTKKQVVMKLDLSVKGRVLPCDAESVGHAIAKSEQLRELNVGSCEIEARGIELLAAGVSLSCSLSKLHLSGTPLKCTLGPAALGAALCRNSYLKELNLSRCQISAEGACGLASGLASNRALKHLLLHSNFFGDKGADALGAALRQNTALESLILSDCAIGSFGATQVARGIVCNETLTRLVLYGNRDIEDDGASQLGNALIQNKSLTELDLGKCGISSAKGLAKGLAQNGTLVKLMLCSNYLISDDGASALGTALATNISLRELDIRDCPIVSLGAQGLARGLAQNTALRSLNVGKNFIGPQGAAGFGLTLQTNQVLQALNFGRCAIGSLGAQSLGMGLANNLGLKMLDLGHNYFGDDGARAIGEALRANTVLVELDVRNCGITCNGAASLATGVSKNTTLKILNLKQNTSIHDDCIPVFGELMSRNRTLRNLDLQGCGLTHAGKMLLKQLESNGSLRLQLSFTTQYQDGTTFPPSYLSERTWVSHPQH